MRVKKWIVVAASMAIAVTPLIATSSEAGTRRSDERSLDAIGYFTKTPSNKVERLHAAIREGKNPLTYDTKFGYLPSLLRTLGINTSTQSMVFSKTSLQIAHISPSNPRALYFSDDIYIGYIPGSDSGQLQRLRGWHPRSQRYRARGQAGV